MLNLLLKLGLNLILKLKWRPSCARFFIVSSGLVFLLSGCGVGEFSVTSVKEAEGTDKNITPENPKVIPKTKTIIGFVTTENLVLSLDKASHRYQLKGRYSILDTDGKALSQADFNLAGAISSQGPSNLLPTSATKNGERLLARLTCLENGEDGFCQQTIVDFYVRRDEKTLATQVLIDLRDPRTEKKIEPEVQAPAEETDKGDIHEHEADVDDQEQEGLFVGTLHEDPTPYFTTVETAPESPATPEEPTAPVTPPPKDQGKTENKPADRTDRAPSVPHQPLPPTQGPPSPPASLGEVPPKVQPVKVKNPEIVAPHSAVDEGKNPDRPRDQAIGLAADGRMEKASSLKALLDAGQSHVDLVHPDRQRYFGTYELVQDVVRMGAYLNKIAPENILCVGDLSKENGGRITTVHKSHQNGLDVDVAYPRTDMKKPDFASLVNGGKVSEKLRVRELFQILEFAHVSLQAVDRIFVDQEIKNTLCSYSKKTNLLESADRGESTAEILRRLRPTEGHDDHFHLRIRCSTEQPRCRMMSEPPPGTGCPKS